MMVYNKFMHIYKVTNKNNGKVYIGLTSMQNRNPKERYWQHLANARNTKRRNKFLDAIRKYGQEVWEFEVIDSSAKTVEELNDKEQMYIKLYNSIDEGYNTHDGGRFHHHTEESKRKIRDNHARPRLGVKDSPETIARKREIQAKTYIVTTPEGIEIEVKDLSKFCKEHFLTQQYMYQIASNTYGKKSHKGYKVRKA